MENPNLKYWNRAIGEYRQSDDDNADFGSEDDPIAVALSAVSQAANWYNEQDMLLIKLARARDTASIREWACEMSTEMVDDNAWDQDFCDAVANKMDELADLIDSTPPHTDWDVESVREAVNSEREDYDADDLEGMFIALYHRAPDTNDKREGVWSHLCAYFGDEDTSLMHLYVYDGESDAGQVIYDGPIEEFDASSADAALLDVITDAKRKPGTHIRGKDVEGCPFTVLVYNPTPPEITEIEFTERGNGYPATGDIVVDHDAEQAYRVLDSIPGTGQGSIVTGNAMRGDSNSTILRVEVLDYEGYNASADWEI